MSAINRVLEYLDESGRGLVNAVLKSEPYSTQRTTTNKAIDPNTTTELLRAAMADAAGEIEGVALVRELGVAFAGLQAAAQGGEQWYQAHSMFIQKWQCLLNWEETRKATPTKVPPEDLMTLQVLTTKFHAGERQLLRLIGAGDLKTFQKRKGCRHRVSEQEVAALFPRKV